MSKPELEAELEAAMGSEENPVEGEIQITNENALIVMAQAMVGIEKHLFALVYLEKTRDPEKTQVTFLSDVFNAIYDGSDPFRDVDEQVKAAADAAKAGKADAG
jgi:hypothetical protein